MFEITIYISICVYMVTIICEGDPLGYRQSERKVPIDCKG